MYGSQLKADQHVSKYEVYAVYDTEFVYIILCLQGLIILEKKCND